MVLMDKVAVISGAPASEASASPPRACSRHTGRASRSSISTRRQEIVAGAFLFLASDLAAGVTVAVIDVNGGLLIH
jgi:enoyl-[acyl-carrier-protein] reductase (NADH)